MALDPRIKVNQDGSYFYSDSVVDGVGRRHHLWKNGGKGYVPDYDDYTLNGDGGQARIAGLNEDYRYLEGKRIDTTAPFCSYYVGSNTPTRTNTQGLDTFRYIYTNWAFSPNRTLSKDGSRRPYLFNDSAKGFAPHFFYSCRNTSCEVYGCIKQKATALLVFNVTINSQYLSNYLDEKVRIYGRPWYWIHIAIRQFFSRPYMQTWLESFLLYGKIEQQSYINIHNVRFA